MIFLNLLKGALVFSLVFLGATYVGITALLYSKQDALLFAADQTPADVSVAGVPGLAAVKVRTSDGLYLNAWFKPPAEGKPTLLYFHGNGGNIMGRVGRVRLFAQTGWGEMFLEYRGYGGNPGKPSENGLNQDALGAMDFLAAHGVPSSRVILFGESMGTGVAVRLATQRKVAAVILDSPYTSVAAVAQHFYWYLPVTLLIKNRFELLGRIDEIQAPLLVLQGARDTIVAPAMGKAVYAAAQAPKQFWEGPRTSHISALETGGWPVMRAFVARYVPGG